jgi:hypothetical protein
MMLSVRFLMMLARLAGCKARRAPRIEHTCDPACSAGRMALGLFVRHSGKCECTYFAYCSAVLAAVYWKFQKMVAALSA